MRCGTNCRSSGSEDTGDLAQARRLFAAAIETPGGLKIQTIHSFCAGDPAAVSARSRGQSAVSGDGRPLGQASAGGRARRHGAGAEAAGARSARAVLHRQRFHRADRGDRAAAGRVCGGACPRTRSGAGLGWSRGSGRPSWRRSPSRRGTGAVIADLIPALERGSTNDVKAATALCDIDPLVLGRR